MRITKPILFVEILLIILLISSCGIKQEVADIVILNATIWTGDLHNSYAESLAIKDDKIIAIGKEDQTKDFISKSTHIIDMKGRFITPGFIDSHVHLMMGGNALLSVGLRNADSQNEFISRIKEYCQTLSDDEWILEGNWDHTLWGGELPNKAWIDAITSSNPMAIYRMDGHMILANSAALKIAGITKNTPDPMSGKILKDANGELTGILKGNAMYAVLNKVPEFSEERKTQALEAAMNYFLENGVTSVHDVDSLGTYSIAKKYSAKQNLKTRICCADPIYNLNKMENQANHLNHSTYLKRGGLKGFVDGSLGSHTACFHTSYTDQPDDKGFFLNESKQLSEWIQDADSLGHQVMVHAIGDSAIHELLDIYESLPNTNRDRRFRVEHAQHLDPNDIPRFEQLGVIASMQPYHAIDDGRWAEEVIGTERIKTTYAFKSLLDAGATIVFGSDWPVAPSSPLLGIYAATTRRTTDGMNPDGWVPQQKISTEQALISYTRNAAYAAFDETRLGSLEIGKLADFVVLSENILQIDPINIQEVKVLETWLGGKKLFPFNN